MTKYFVPGLVTLIFAVTTTGETPQAQLSRPLSPADRITMEIAALHYDLGDIEKALDTNSTLGLTLMTQTIEQRYNGVRGIFRTRHPGTAKRLESALERAKKLIDGQAGKAVHFAKNVEDSYGPTGGSGCENLISDELKSLNGGTFDHPSLPRTEFKDEIKNYRREQAALNSQLPESNDDPEAPEGESETQRKRRIEINAELSKLPGKYRINRGKEEIAGKIGNYNKSILFKTKSGTEIEVLYQQEKMVAFQVTIGKTMYTNEVSAECRIKRTIRHDFGDTPLTSVRTAVNPKFCAALPVLTPLFAKAQDLEKKQKKVNRSGMDYADACRAIGGEPTNNCVCKNGNKVHNPWYEHCDHSDADKARNALRIASAPTGIIPDTLGDGFERQKETCEKFKNSLAAEPNAAHDTEAPKKTLRR